MVIDRTPFMSHIFHYKYGLLCIMTTQMNKLALSDVSMGLGFW